MNEEKVPNFEVLEVPADGLVRVLQQLLEEEESAHRASQLVPGRLVPFREVRFTNLAPDGTWRVIVQVAAKCTGPIGARAPMLVGGS